MKEINLFSIDESCEENCGDSIDPVNFPLPNCKYNCFTTSEEKNALESCEENCGFFENFVKIPLPKCEKYCYTTSQEKNALKSCVKGCYNKNNVKIFVLDQNLYQNVSFIVKLPLKKKML